MHLVFASLPFRTSCLNVHPIPSVERLEEQIVLDNSIIFLFGFILGFSPSKICFMVKMRVLKVHSIFSLIFFLLKFRFLSKKAWSSIFFLIIRATGSKTQITTNIKNYLLLHSKTKFATNPCNLHLCKKQTVYTATDEGLFDSWGTKVMKLFSICS